MKLIRVISVFLLVSMLLTICSCGNGGKASKVTVSELETSLQDWLNDSITLTVSEEGGGCSFSGSVESYVAKASVSGKANKSKQLQSVTIVSQEIDVSKLNDTDRLTSLLTTLMYDSGKMTMKDLAASQCVMNAMGLYELFKKDDSSAPEGKIKDFIEVFSSGETKKVGDWTITASLDSSAGTCTITAKFAG